MTTLYVHGKDMEIIGHLDSDMPNALNFYDDTLTLYLSGGNATFDFTVDKYKNGRRNHDADILTDECFISTVYEDEALFFTVNRVVETHYKITLECDSINQRLLNSQISNYETEEPVTLMGALKGIGLFVDNKVVVDVNEYNESAAKISISGNVSLYGAIIQIATTFGADVKFKTHTLSDGSYNYTSVSFFRPSGTGVGTNRTDVQLQYGRDLKDIEKESDKSNLFNCLRFRDKEGNLIKFRHAYTDYSSDGIHVDVYNPRQSVNVYAPQSMMKYPSLNRKVSCDNWTYREIEIDPEDYADEREMFDYASSLLKNYMYPQTTYKVTKDDASLLEEHNVRLGDTIYFTDPDFIDGLYVSARVSQIKTSLSAGARSTTSKSRMSMNKTEYTLTNFRRLKSQVASTFAQRVDEILDDRMGYEIKLRSDGTIFKNGEGSYKIIPEISRGGKSLETKPLFTYIIVHQGYNEPDIYAGEGEDQSFTVEADMLKGGLLDVYVNAVIEGDVVAEERIQFVNVNDGIDGQNARDGVNNYIHIAYADDKNGNGFSQEPANKKFIGIYKDNTEKDSTDPKKYKWTKMSGEDGQDGSDGSPGVPGKDGRTPYTHWAWANSLDGTVDFSVTNGDEREYIGVYTDFNKPDSTDPSKYTWTHTKGDKGSDGKNGKDGAPGKSSYMHLAYANDDRGTGFSQLPTGKTHIGIYYDTNPVDSTDPNKYTWNKYVGEDGQDGTNGVPGKPGADGRTPYFHTAWATNITGTTGFSTSVSAGKTHIGVYSDFVQADSTDPSRYSWTLIKGDKGTPGQDGRTSYFHVAYATSKSGAGFSQDPTGKTYIGTYTDFVQADSTDPSKYTWNKFVGEDGQDGVNGVPGAKGADGRTSYFHTAWATNANGTVGFSTSVSSGKTYIGVYSDFTLADSTNPADYSWSLIKGDKGEPGQKGLDGKNGVNGKDGAKGATGPQGAKGDKGDKGADGAKGADGKDGKSVLGVVDLYQSTTTNKAPSVITSAETTSIVTKVVTDKKADYYTSTNREVGKWRTTPIVPGKDDKYVWKQSVTVYSDSTHTTQLPLLVTTTAQSAGRNWLLYSKGDTAKGLFSSATIKTDWNGVSYGSFKHKDWATNNPTSTNRWSSINLASGMVIKSLEAIPQGSWTISYDWRMDWSGYASTMEFASRPTEPNHDSSAGLFYTAMTGKGRENGLPKYSCRALHWQLGDDDPNVSGNPTVNPLGDIVRNDKIEVESSLVPDELGNAMVKYAVTMRPTGSAQHTSLRTTNNGFFIRTSGMPDKGDSNNWGYYFKIRATKPLSNISIGMERIGFKSISLTTEWQEVFILNAGANGEYHNFRFYGTDLTSSTTDYAIFIDEMKIFKSSTTEAQARASLIPNRWYHMESTLVPNEVNRKKYTKLDTFLSLGISNGNYGGSVDLRNVKLEQGDYATPWTPAPEDSIAELEQKADLEYTNQRLLEQSQSIEQTQRMMEFKASVEAIDKLEKYAKEISDTQKKISDDIKLDLSKLADRAVKIQTDLGDQMQKWVAQERYITMSEEGISLGRTGTNTKVLINDETISFINNGEPVMKITHSTIEISRGIFTESVRIGRYIEKQHDSDININIKYYTTE